ETSITAAAAFRSARKDLGVQSKRHGFGPGASYSWELPMDVDEHAAKADEHEAVVGDVHDDVDEHDDKHASEALVAQWVEGLDYLRTLEKPPFDWIDDARWQQYLSDYKRFLDFRQLALLAARRGWSERDLFNVPERAHATDGGLIWFAAG